MSDLTKLKDLLKKPVPTTLPEVITRLVEVESILNTIIEKMQTRNF